MWPSLRLLCHSLQVKNIWGTQAAGLAGSGNMAAAANAPDSVRVSSCLALLAVHVCQLVARPSRLPFASATLAWGQILLSLYIP